MTTAYAHEIAKHTALDPRIVESLMRCEYGTLDRLTSRQFAAECRLAEEAFAEDPDTCRALARSYGFRI